MGKPRNERLDDGTQSKNVFLEVWAVALAALTPVTPPPSFSLLPQSTDSPILRHALLSVLHDHIEMMVVVNICPQPTAPGVQMTG